MGDMSSDARDKIRVARINDPNWLGQEAKRMAKDLLLKEYEGPGDTIEAAAHRIQVKRGVDASIILQGWNRPAREMMVSRWMSLFMAHYQAFASKTEAAYEEMRNEATGCHPALVGLADFVAGRTGSKASEAQVEEE